jgi:hypothetical protein
MNVGVEAILASDDDNVCGPAKCVVVVDVAVNVHARVPLGRGLICEPTKEELEPKLTSSAIENLTGLISSQPRDA